MVLESFTQAQKKSNRLANDNYYKGKQQMMKIETSREEAEI